MIKVLWRIEEDKKQGKELYDPLVKGRSRTRSKQEHTNRPCT